MSCRRRLNVLSARLLLLRQTVTYCTDWDIPASYILWYKNEYQLLLRSNKIHKAL